MTEEEEKKFRMTRLTDLDDEDDKKLVFCDFCGFVYFIEAELKTTECMLCKYLLRPRTVFRGFCVACSAPLPKDSASKRIYCSTKCRQTRNNYLRAMITPSYYEEQMHNQRLRGVQEEVKEDDEED